MISSRRTFLRRTATAASVLALSPFGRFSSAFARPSRGLVFQPFPHPQMPAMRWAYAADEYEDPFKSPVSVTKDGISVPEEMGDRKFSINARWYVEGFGYLWLSADNGGRRFSLKDFSSDARLNLNYEFARSRVERNRSVRERYEKQGATFSPEVLHLTALSEELLHDAGKPADAEACARRSDRALLYALQAGERIELEKAYGEIAKSGARDVHFGCETRQFIWAKSEEVQKRFRELMSFATVTHYAWDSWYELFEPTEGRYNWGIKDDIVRWLVENDIPIEGRPLFWFHPTVTPDWLKQKSFDDLKKYIDRHVADLVMHYGDRVRQWEVVNEYHDWANIHNHTPEQITELTRRMCDRTHEVDPKVVRIINNCCPWAEYAATGRMARMDATRPLRSPRKYLHDLAEAGVEYDVLGIQIYFPQRDLSDVVRLLERLAVLGKPIYITEIGASSNLLAQSSSGAITGTASEPYAWHRPWDEELQADWLEQMYTVCLGKQYIKAVNWYDFSDFRPFIVNGGLVREDGSVKQSFDRLKGLLAAWGRLPGQHK